MDMHVNKTQDKKEYEGQVGLYRRGSIGYMVVCCDIYFLAELSCFRPGAFTAQVGESKVKKESETY